MAMTISVFIHIISLLLLANSRSAEAQEKLKTSYASVGATNAIWNIAKERGFYKKYGLDVEVVYIGSSVVTVAAILGKMCPSPWLAATARSTRRSMAPTSSASPVWLTSLTTASCAR